MKISIILLFLCCLLFSNTSFSQDYYWIGFSNKKGTLYSLSNPSPFLSQRAIQRRIKQSIPIDSLDLPLNTVYIQKVLNFGATMVNTSKWLNGITVKSSVDTFLTAVKKLAYVREIQLTKPASATKSANKKVEPEDLSGNNIPIDTSKYGNSVHQVGQLNGQYLHNQDIKGQGMVIAILDAGFYNANIYQAFDSLRAKGQILGTRDFVNRTSDIFAENNHGMNVLSCMGGNIPGKLIGTAPKASYWLLRSEDVSTEYPIEEDNWVAAAEFADSVGCDVINSSLGYSEFDDSKMNHPYKEMDGKTTRVTRGANIAASRGILVFASAGNEGNKPWRKIIAPADGDKVIAVGAVNKSGIPASFTSHGPASDGDVKPNVSAIGWNTWLQLSNGTLGYSNGTSFSSPVMAGMGTCLWQANPKATAAQVKSAIEQSSHLFFKPDSLLGFGIPDMKIADQILKTLFIKPLETEKSWLAYPNPVSGKLILKYQGIANFSNIKLSVYDLAGQLLLVNYQNTNLPLLVTDLSNIPAGLLMVKIETENNTEILKLTKIR